MPRDDQEKYTDNPKSQAEHIEDSYEKRGEPNKEEEKSPWALVNIKIFEESGLNINTKRRFGYSGL